MKVEQELYSTQTGTSFTVTVDTDALTFELIVQPPGADEEHTERRCQSLEALAGCYRDNVEPLFANDSICDMDNNEVVYRELSESLGEADTLAGVPTVDPLSEHPVDQLVAELAQSALIQLNTWNGGASRKLSSLVFSELELTFSAYVNTTKLAGRSDRALETYTKSNPEWLDGTWVDRNFFSFTTVDCRPLEPFGWRNDTFRVMAMVVYRVCALLERMQNLGPGLTRAKGFVCHGIVHNTHETVSAEMRLAARNMLSQPADAYLEAVAKQGYW